MQFLTLSFSFILPNYIQLVNNSNATVAGLLLLPAALMGAILSPFSGLILDKFGPQKPIILGSSLILIGTLLFWIFSSNLSNLLITIFYIVYMIGLGFAFGNIMTNSLKQLSKEQNADGNALLNTLQQFAGAMGTAVISTIITQTQQTTHSYVNGAHNAIILLVILSILEVVLISTALKKRRSLIRPLLFFRYLYSLNDNTTPTMRITHPIKATMKPGNIDIMNCDNFCSSIACEFCCNCLSNF